MESTSHITNINNKGYSEFIRKMKTYDNIRPSSASWLFNI